MYNGAPYLRRCLESLLHQQTRYDYEVVCVNDGSTDGSLSILEQMLEAYPDRLVVCTQKNGGISSARNKGIALAHGRYIGFVDNDDTVSPDYVEKILTAAETHDADMVQCGHRRVSTTGAELYAAPIVRSTVVLDNDHSADYVEQLSGFVWAGAYRREIFERTRFNVGFWYEDMITKVLLGRQSRRTVLLSDCLYDYTLTGSNSSDVLWRSTSTKALDQLILPMRLYAFSEQVLGLPHDEALDCLMIHELCWQLPNRAARVSAGLLKAAFVVVSDFMRSHGIRTEDSRHGWATLCKAAISGDYLRWKYRARAEMWRSKMV